jgi:hypothetical protein
MATTRLKRKDRKNKVVAKNKITSRKVATKKVTVKSPNETQFLES